VVPDVSAEPKNLAVIAKRVNLTGIGCDLNDLPCHTILGIPVMADRHSI
jgi:hypothetical protein